MDKKILKPNKGNMIALILIIISLIVFICSLIYIIFWYRSNKQNTEIKAKLQESIVIDDNIEEDKYNIDFDTLKSRNNETIGYLKVNNTSVDYIVTQAKNNDYYLNHNFNKEWNISGWIFVDYRNKLDGTDIQHIKNICPCKSRKDAVLMAVKFLENKE